MMIHYLWDLPPPEEALAALTWQCVVVEAGGCVLTHHTQVCAPAHPVLPGRQLLISWSQGIGELGSRCWIENSVRCWVQNRWVMGTGELGWICRIYNDWVQGSKCWVHNRWVMGIGELGSRCWVQNRWGMGTGEQGWICRICNNWVLGSREQGSCHWIWSNWVLGTKRLGLSQQNRHNCNFLLPFCRIWPSYRVVCFILITDNFLVIWRRRKLVMLWLREFAIDSSLMVVGICFCLVLLMHLLKNMIWLVLIQMCIVIAFSLLQRHRVHYFSW